MTVENTTTKVVGTLNGSATVFSFSPLVIFESSDLVVTLVDEDGNESPLAEGTGASNYSVTVSSYPGTGSITYPATGSAADDGSLVMKRVLPLTQETDLENQGGYFADTQEQALDRLCMVDLQQQETLDRSLKFPTSDTDDPVDLPTAANRANKVLAFDSDGQPTASTVETGTLTSSVMEPVVGAATLASARTEMEVAGLADDNDFSGAITFSGTVDITGTIEDLTLTSTDAGAGVGPTLTLFRDSASPAANDVLGAVSLHGRDAGAGDTEYVRYGGVITDTTAAPAFGSKDGEFVISIAVASAITEILRGTPTGLKFRGNFLGCRGAMAWNSANQSIPNATLTALTFDSEAYDTDTIHSTSSNTSRLTVPTGVTKIRLRANVTFAAASAGSTRYAEFYKNGTTSAFAGGARQSEGNNANADQSIQLQSAVLTVTDGDYFEVRVNQNSAAALNVIGGNSGADTWFAMEILG